jgi:hypothetical protein
MLPDSDGVNSCIPQSGRSSSQYFSAPNASKRPNPDINVANNWALKVLRVFGAMLLKIHVDLLCWA